VIAVAEAVLRVLREGGRGALATVVRTKGSTPQQPGARMLILADGTQIGTVGGGALEHSVLEACRACLRTGRAELLARDLARDLGMCCGGRMEVFVEPIEGRPRLIVFGAGHVAQPTATLANTLGFRVTVVDEREELNDEVRFPDAVRIHSTPRDARNLLAPTEHDWLLVTTHDHHLDEEALETYASLPHRYLGLIGSRRKVLNLLARIEERSGSIPLERVYAPVGLDLGAVSPEEIAVSIAAELVALRRGTPANHMRSLGQASRSAGPP
jgi:xanthine dehydrogenase accessory factor